MSDIRALHRLAALPLFTALDERDLSALAGAVVKRVQVDKGALLYLQGEYSRTYYVLDRGSARLLRVEGDGVERVVRELMPGQAVGEGALLVGESRDVTLEATDESAFFTIERAALEAFCAGRPDIAPRLTPREEVLRRRDASRLAWQRADEVLLHRGRYTGWAVTTRRLVHQDLLGRRQVALRRVRDVRPRRAWLLGRWLDVGRVEVLTEGDKRLVWRRVAHPQRLADLIFTEVGRDQARAQAEARARARRALSVNVPPEPPSPHPDPLLSGEKDWLAVGLWWLADWLATRLLPLAERGFTPPEGPHPPADAPPEQSAPRPSRESSL